MCGIAGTLALGRPLAPEEAQTAKAMGAALRHRGPDGEGFLADSWVALANTRLAVTDLSDRAALPMAAEDGLTWLAFNGAVTNFKDLSAEFRLEEKRPLRSRSDAEVVLRLHEERGLGLLEELAGMFAFCLYDRRAGKAWLVRDPFGLRPLYYRESRGRLHFASEIKALLELEGPREADPWALWHYFSLGYTPGERTPFAGIRELRPGELIEVDLRAGRLARRRWRRLRYEPDESLDEEAAALRLRGLLSDAVSRGLDCDAPAGLTLSGGLDTSGLLGLAKAQGRSRGLHTFSLKMADPTFDESRFQRMMVDFAGPVHHEVEVGPEEVEEALYASVAHLDEPTADGAAVPTFLLSRAARPHVAVLLSGEGGDELFNAYETHRAFGLRRLYRGLAPAWARALARGLAARLPVSHGKLSLDFLAKRFTEGAELGEAEAHLHWRHVLSEPQKAALLPAEWRSGETAGLFRAHYDRAESAEGLDRIAALDLEYYFTDDLMVKNDRMMMAHSVEARFPYMDRPVADFALRIPCRLKVRGLSGRRVQKRALAGLLPPAILKRSNMGLEMPHSRWFLGPLRALGARHFSRENLARSGLLDAPTVTRLWGEHLSRRKDHGRALWAVLNFLVWHELFIGERSHKRHLAATRASGGALDRACTKAP